MSLEKIKQAVVNGTPADALDEAVQQAGFREDAEKLGETLLECWRGLHIGAVVKLLQLLRESGLGEGLLKCVQTPLVEELKLARDWTKRLEAIKLGRTLSAMRGAVREKRPAEALRLAEAVAALDDLPKTLPLIGSTLGTCPDADARQIAQALGSRLNLEPEELFLIHSGIDGRAKAMRSGSAADNPEREFDMERVNATVELAKSLPRERPKTKEEQAAAEEAFAKQVRAILAAGVRFPDRDLWPDIAKLLMEFLPRETGTAAKLSGVEQRQFQTLQHHARRVCLVTFKALGDSDAIAAQFLKLARRFDKEEDSSLLLATVEILGALRNPAAQPFLVDLLKRSKGEPRLQSAIVEALGSLAVEDSETVKLLFTYLRSAFAKPRLDEAARKRARRAISALAKIARNPNAQENDRQSVMMTLRQVVPAGERDLQSLAVTELLTPKLVAKADPATRQWAARVLTEDLWSPDQQPAIASGDLDSPKAPLGKRAAAVELLVPLAKTELPTILEIAEPKASNFSGAMMALGEVFAQQPDNLALPLIERMIDAAANYSAQREGEYAQEQVWDPAAEAYVALDREPVLESLVYAAARIADTETERNSGTPSSGARFLVDLYGRVKSGDLPALGEKASRHLFDGHKKHSSGFAPAGVPSPAKAQAETIAAQPPSGLSPEEREALVKQLQKGGFFASKRRQNKIVAMQRLATAGDLETLPLLIEHLQDKDALVAAAAGTALIEYTRPNHPPAIARDAVKLMATTLGRAGFALQKPLRAAMSQMNLRREPCRKALAAALKKDDGLGLAYELSQIMGLPSPEAAYQAITGEAPIGSDPIPDLEGVAGSEGAPPAAASALGGGSVSALEEKRRLLAARRAWIAGGKKGDEPK